MKAFIITQICLNAIAFLTALSLFLAGKSQNPRKDVLSILFAIAWIVWGFYLLAGSR